MVLRYGEGPGASFFLIKWEDTIKSITQVYLQQIRIKKIQIIPKNKQNSYMHTIISEKSIYN